MRLHDRADRLRKRRLREHLDRQQQLRGVWTRVHHAEHVRRQRIGRRLRMHSQLWLAQLRARAQRMRHFVWYLSVRLPVQHRRPVHLRAEELRGCVRESGLWHGV